MKSSTGYPMQGNVEVDEFVVGGKEKGKVGGKGTYHLCQNIISHRLRVIMETTFKNCIQ